MAGNPRSTTPAWQDPHLKDRGDYTEQDIQNIRGKGGILPDFTLDEAEETYLFARVAQALSKTLTRQVCFVKLGSAFCAVFFRSVGSGFSAGCAVSAAACLRCVVVVLLVYLVMRACSLL